MRGRVVDSGIKRDKATGRRIKTFWVLAWFNQSLLHPAAQNHGGQITFALEAPDKRTASNLAWEIVLELNPNLKSHVEDQGTSNPMHAMLSGSLDATESLRRTPTDLRLRNTTLWPREKTIYAKNPS
jgi:hypothetical protein